MLSDKQSSSVYRPSPFPFLERARLSHVRTAGEAEVKWTELLAGLLPRLEKDPVSLLHSEIPQSLRTGIIHFSVY